MSGARRPSPTSTFLYWHFDADGLLLYVGISIQAIARFSGHRSTAHWAHLVARIDIEAYPTRDAALTAEKTAIKNERPRYNVIGFSGGDGERTEKVVYRRADEERRALWPKCLERRYGISSPTRWRWERDRKLPPRDVNIGGKTGWRPETIEAAETPKQTAAGVA